MPKLAVAPRTAKDNPFAPDNPVLMSNQAKLNSLLQWQESEHAPFITPLTYDQTLAARLPANLHNGMEQLPIARLANRHRHSPSWKHPFHQQIRLYQ
jgi:hypothetical protein